MPGYFQRILQNSIVPWIWIKNTLSANLGTITTCNFKMSFGYSKKVNLQQNSGQSKEQQNVLKPQRLEEPEQVTITLYFEGQVNCEKVWY